jgi:hypothetical protein
MPFRPVRARFPSLPALASALFVLLLVGAQPAHAQLSTLKWRVHGGVMNAMATGDDYFSLGPSVAVDAAYPLAERVDLQLDLGWDYLNTDDTHPSPVTNLWRYRAELEGRLVGDGESGLSVSAFGGAGLTTLYSHKFYLVSQAQKHIREEGVPYTYEGERLRGTSLTGTGGLRIGAHSPDGIMWWLTGKLNYMPLNQFNQDALHELSTNSVEPNGLSPISSVVNFAITLGVSL